MRISLDIENKESVIRWLNEIRKGSGDARPLWLAVVPKIIEFVNFEFSSTVDKHKRWESLNSIYKKWKVTHGFPSGIGVLTGKLRRGAGLLAKKKMRKRDFVWELNQSGVVSKKGYSYAPVFHFGKRDGSQPPRTIYKFTALRLNSFLKLDAKKFSDGTVHANFTYKWLKKSLESFERF